MGRIKENITKGKGEKTFTNTKIAHFKASLCARIQN
jgi:hypothetical protein